MGEAASIIKFKMIFLLKNKHAVSIFPKIQTQVEIEWWNLWLAYTHTPRYSSFGALFSTSDIVARYPYHAALFYVEYLNLRHVKDKYIAFTTSLPLSLVNIFT